MLHGSRPALVRFTGLCLCAAILTGCRSGEVSPERARSAKPAAVTPSDTPAPLPPLLAPAGSKEEHTVQPSRHGLVLADRQGKATVRVDTTSGKAPEDWPSEVPVYPGGKIQMSMQLGRGATLTLETADAIPKVIGYYEAQLANMPQSKAVDSDGNQTRIWSDPSKPLQVTLTLNAERGVTRATLIVTRERQAAR